MVALYTVVSNFTKIHKTLRVTPAMAARLTDRVWDMAHRARRDGRYGCDLSAGHSIGVRPLPGRTAGRPREGLTAAKMKECVWLKPTPVARIEFLEWTGEHHLRHTRFIALRDDKPARDVRRE